MEARERVVEGFASSRRRRVRFVRVSVGAESMESGGQSFFALHSGFRLGAWIAHIPTALSGFGARAAIRHPVRAAQG